MAKKKDWREEIEPADSFYIYQGALWCQDDGEAIRKDLMKAGEAPKDPDDESSYESDYFPKGPFQDQDEADWPSHCAAGEGCLNAIKLPYDGKLYSWKIGQWLGNKLTDDGARRVAEMIRDGLFIDDLHARQIGRLWRYLYRDQIEGWNTLERWKGEIKRGAPLEAILAWAKIRKILLNRVYSNLDAIYGIGSWIKDKSEIAVIKIEVLPDGYFDVPVIVSDEVFKGRDPVVVLRELTEQGF
jgi:hypothetical protein